MEGKCKGNLRKSGWLRKGPSGCGSARPVAEGPETMVLYGFVVAEGPVQLRTGPSSCGWTLYPLGGRPLTPGAAPRMSRAALAGGVGVNADAVSLFSRFDFLISFKFNFN